MSTATLKIIFAVVFIGHGIGHAMPFLALAGIKLSESHSMNSWLFSNLLGNTLTNIIGVLIFLAALLGFLCAGLGLLGWLVPSNLWHTLALVAGLISLVGLFLFWNAFPFLVPNKIGVILVDVAVLVSILFLELPAKLS